MENLKQETLEIMSKYGKGIDDIAFVCGDDYIIPTELFWKRADTEYEPSFGIVDVATDLKVVFCDGSWLGRYNYDCSEWWEYKKTPSENDMVLERDVPSLFGWDDTLNEIRQGL